MTGYYEYEVRRRSVWVVGLHLQADEGLISGEKTREAQMAEIEQWINAGITSGKFKIDAGDPVIFAGDFNVKFIEEPEGERDGCREREG